jgi:hypothetical protein
MKKMKKRKIGRSFLKAMKILGLKLDSDTGGYCNSHVAPASISKSEPFYEWKMDSKNIVMFMSPQLFLKTVRATEDSLKINLFEVC